MSSPKPNFGLADAVTLPFPHLSGAVDIVVVKQKDGSLSSSPFYVRFGKYQGLLKRREKQVHITVNDETVSYTMRLGRTGVAYFAPPSSQKKERSSHHLETEEDSIISPSGYSSPDDMLSPTSTKSHYFNEKYFKGFQDSNMKTYPESETPHLLLESEQDSEGDKAGEDSDEQADTEDSSHQNEFTETETNGDEVTNNADLLENNTNASCKEPEGNLDELNAGDANRSALFSSLVSIDGDEEINPFAAKEGSSTYELEDQEQIDVEPVSWSTEYASETQKIVKMSGLSIFRGMEISLCGDMIEKDEITTSEVMALFRSNLVNKEAFQEQRKEMTFNPLLICRIGNILVPWVEVLQILLGYLVYHEYPDNCPSKVMLLQPNRPVDLKWNPNKSSEEGWKIFSWLSTFRSPVPNAKAVTIDNESPTKDNPESGDSPDENPEAESSSGMFIPSSPQLEMLKLAEGRNKITYTCYSSLWGTQTASAYIYLLPWNSKIVVSDVDGTITKSDVLGHVMTAMGRDWSHSGVTKLFTDIEANGYQLMYLSARSIGQASLTRDFLFNLNQNGAKLPIGPVIISPDGILPSLFREMVLKRPHEFKIASLQTIKDLFPEDWNPFYAGFGNRSTDEVSYVAVGIPSSRIFTINPRGEVTLNSASACHTSTWCTLQGINELVHDLFPHCKGDDHEDYSEYNFWRMEGLLVDDVP